MTTTSSIIKLASRRTREKPSKILQPTCVLNGVDQGTWCIGKVQKIRRKVGTRWGSCKHLIDLFNREVNKGKKNKDCWIWFYGLS